MTTAIHRRVRALNEGADPTLITRVPSGWIVLGDPQVLYGYCLLLADPVVPHLNVLDARSQAAYLADLARLGDAILAVTAAVRCNYAIFGNLEPALHAHVFPRYADEPAALRTANPWGYDWSAAPRYSQELHGPLQARLRTVLGAA